MTGHGTTKASSRRSRCRQDRSHDRRADLRRLAQWLNTSRACGVMTNGHTGEVFGLTWEERAEVTRIVADAVKGKFRSFPPSAPKASRRRSSRRDAKAAGATGLDIMPPHHWLRFGMRSEHVVDYFAAIGEATGLDLAVHVYPRGPRVNSCETPLRSQD